MSEAFYCNPILLNDWTTHLNEVHFFSSFSFVLLSFIWTGAQREICAELCSPYSDGDVYIHWITVEDKHSEHLYDFHVERLLDVKVEMIKMLTF